MPRGAALFAVTRSCTEPEVQHRSGYCRGPEASMQSPRTRGPSPSRRLCNHWPSGEGVRGSVAACGSSCQHHRVSGQPFPRCCVLRGEWHVTPCPAGHLAAAEGVTAGDEKRETQQGSKGGTRRQRQRGSSTALGLGAYSWQHARYSRWEWYRCTDASRKSESSPAKACRMQQPAHAPSRRNDARLPLLVRVLPRLLLLRRLRITGCRRSRDG